MDNQDEKKLDEMQEERSQDEIQKEIDSETNKKVFKTGAKGVATYLAPGVGGKIVDIASKTKLGGAIANIGGKAVSEATKTSPLGKGLQGVLNKANETGALDAADSAISLADGSLDEAGALDATDSAMSLAGGSSNQTGTTPITGAASGEPLSESTSPADDITKPLGKKLGGIDLFSSSPNFKIPLKIKLILIGITIGLFSLIILITLFLNEFKMIDLTSSPKSKIVVTDERASEIMIIINNEDKDVFYDTLSGVTILDEIGQEGIDQINNEIKKEVEDAGICTPSSVAMAVTTLITELTKRELSIPYYWDGKFDIPIVENNYQYLNPSWGEKTTEISDNNGKKYYYKGLDCTGLSNWAINAAGVDMPLYTNHTNNSTIVENFEDLKPGFLLANDTHVAIVLGIDGNKVHTAESLNTSGVRFFTRTKQDATNNYKMLDMTTYFAENCR